MKTAASVAASYPARCDRLSTGTVSVTRKHALIAAICRLFQVYMLLKSHVCVNFKDVTPTKSLCLSLAAASLPRTAGTRKTRVPWSGRTAFPPLMSLPFRHAV